MQAHSTLKAFSHATSACCSDVCGVGTGPTAVASCSSITVPPAVDTRVHGSIEALVLLALSKRPFGPLAQLPAEVALAIPGGYYRLQTSQLSTVTMKLSTACTAALPQIVSDFRPTTCQLTRTSSALLSCSPAPHAYTSNCHTAPPPPRAGSPRVVAVLRAAFLPCDRPQPTLQEVRQCQEFLHMTSTCDRAWS
jgi:hypothetical protein